MNKIGIFVLTFIICTQLTTRLLFAQNVGVKITQGHEIAQANNASNPTPTSAQPSPTAAPTTAPTGIVTPTQNPSQQQSMPTTQPVSSQVQPTSRPGPTATPTPITPTPTRKPVPLALTHPIKPPPPAPVSKIITAPLDLVMNSLPKSYYNDQGLAPRTTKVLIAASVLCIASGILLISWPFLVRIKKRGISALRHESNPIPYLAGGAS